MHKYLTEPIEIPESKDWILAVRQLHWGKCPLIRCYPSSQITSREAVPIYLTYWQCEKMLTSVNMSLNITVLTVYIINKIYYLIDSNVSFFHCYWSWTFSYNIFFFCVLPLFFFWVCSSLYFIIVIILYKIRILIFYHIYSHLHN